MKLVVVESPLAGDFVRNRAYALWAAYDCHKRGEAAFASHLFYTQFLNDQDANERAFGIAAGLAWAERADLRVFYVDLGASPGMLEALVLCGEHDQACEDRTLPPEMLRAFKAGGTPSTTPGFGT